MLRRRPRSTLFPYTTLFRSLLDREIAVHDALGHQTHVRHDAFPLRHFRLGLHPLELLAEGAGVEVAGKLRRAPGAAARWQVSGQLVEALLGLRRGQELQQQPGLRLVARAAKDHQARAARDRGARAIRPRHGRGHPGVLLLRRQAAREFANVPGAGDVEGKVAAPELVPDVGDLRAVDRRRPLALEDLAVEAQRALKAGAAEVTVATVRTQQRLRLLYREHQ